MRINLIAVFMSCLLSVSTTVAAKSTDLNEVRWNLPLDEWGRTDYFLKGKFLNIQMKEGNSPTLKFYKNPSLKNFFFSLSGNKILFEKDYCELKNPVPVKKVDQFILCGDGYCEERYESGEIFNLNLVPYKWFYSKTNLDNCPVKPFVLNKPLSDAIDENSYEKIFIIKSFDEEKKIAEVQINDSEYSYLDLKICSMAGFACKEEIKQVSEYEIDLRKLAEIKKAKSLKPLNDLLKYLLPCVKKKDSSCIESFFITRNDADRFSPARGFKLSSVNIDAELISELERCLSYDSLLPHLLATRGINKVCMFFEAPSSMPLGGSTKLFPLTYPEAVRRNFDREINFEIPR